MKFNSLKVKRFFIATMVVLATMPALAAENIISSVVISKSKDRANAYELNIDSSQQVQYKSHIDEDGNVFFDLKNSTLAPDMGTIYDNVSNIDNVTVKQFGKNRVRIYVNGQDAKNTELIFVNSLFETSKDTAKNVVINRPINEYKSTTYDNDLEYEDDMQDWDDNSFNMHHLNTIIMSELKDGPAGKILIFLSLFAVLAIIFKALTSKVAQDKEPLIGLNSAKYLDKNVQIGSLGSSVKMPVREELPSVSNRNEALRAAQVELTKAHQKYQQYIQNKYQGTQKPKTVDVDALKKSIALNQYQKSTQNPYKNQEVLKMNNGFVDDAPRGNYQIPPRPRMAQQTQRGEFTSPYIKRTNNFVNTNTNTKKEQPRENMRFLESVSKIYERSGRGDLAHELKNSITKAKQTI